jgi:hypothetical protein
MPGPKVPLRTGSCPFVRDVRQHLVEVRGTNRNVMDAAAPLGEEARVVALVVERLDQLPLDRADHRRREPPGAVDRPSVLVQRFRFARRNSTISHGPIPWSSTYLCTAVSRSRTTIPICIVSVKEGCRNHQSSTVSRGPAWASVRECPREGRPSAMRGVGLPLIFSVVSARMGPGGDLLRLRGGSVRRIGCLEVGAS